VVASARTLPEVPAAAPRMARGGFEVVAGLQERQIYVYWQQIPREQQHGPDFHYFVSEVKEGQRVR